MSESQHFLVVSFDIKITYLHLLWTSEDCPKRGSDWTRPGSERNVVLIELVVDRRFEAEILALQEQVDLPEVGPVLFVALPTLAHQVVDLPRTVLRDARQHLIEGEERNV